MTPVLYCLAKALRMETGSLYKSSRVVRDTSQNNASHLDQCPLAEVDILLERTSEMLLIAVRKISQKRVHLAGSTVTRASSVGKSYPCKQARRRQ